MLVTATHLQEYKPSSWDSSVALIINGLSIPDLKSHAWAPIPGKQQQFIESTADITIFGGGAGGGKSIGLLLDPLKDIDNPGFGAVIFRKSFPQIKREGGLRDQSQEIYPDYGGHLNETELYWRFPSGAKVAFAQVDSQADVEGWKGAQIADILWDQLEEHQERVFFYLMSRNRSTCGVKPRIRATVNPDPDSFVARFIEWWIDQDQQSPTYGLPIEERAGVVRWFARDGAKWLWADSKEGLLEEHPTLEPDQPKSVTFIPARLEDNPILTQKDPGYRANLLAQDYVDQQRLLHGNWKVRAAAGKVFARSWFRIVPGAPAGGEEGTGWDLAATEKKGKGHDPDYTAYVTMRKVKGRYYVLDFQLVHVGPAEVDTLMLNVTTQKAKAAKDAGANYRVRWEREPAGAGKRDNYRIVQLLSGFDGRGVPPRGDKVVRAKPMAAAAFGGNIDLVESDWNEAFLQHYHAFPDGPHDDGVDAGDLIYDDLSRYSWDSGEQEKQEQEEKQEAA